MNEVYWQNECKGNKSRAEHILQNEKFTDCQFIVGQESDKAVTIRSHKLILATASPVFERMFYGSFDDEKSDEIRIQDIKHNIFHMMLNYIYFEEIGLITVNDAMELYSAAHKYMLQDLMRRSMDYLLDIITHIEIPNRWKIYEFAVFFEENVLITVAGDAMAYNAKVVLKSPSFVNAKFTTLIALFERDDLLIDSELDLFHGLEKYALANGYVDTNNDVENKEVESEKKKVLREALKKIRFLCLTPKQLEVVAKSGLLTDSEVFSILWNLNGLGERDHPMPEGFCKSRKQRTRKYY